MKNIDENYFKQNTDGNELTFEQMLKNDEKILYQSTPKKISYVLGRTIAFAPFAILWAIIDFSVIGFMLSSGELNEMLFFIIPFMALHLMPVWIWIGSMIKASKDVKNTKYYITNKRFVCIKGKNQYIDSSIEIEDLTSCELKIGFIDKMLKVGDIYLSSKKCSFVMFDIYDSEFIHNKISSLINNDNKSDTFYIGSKTCMHCGSSCKQGTLKCPNCGASFNKR